MTHHHHSHDHNHNTESELSFDEKITKILNHWIKHNDDHAQTYEDWAEKAKQHEMSAVSKVLQEIAKMTIDISKKFEQAGQLLDQQKK